MSKAEKEQILRGMLDALVDMITADTEVDMNDPFVFACNMAHVSLTRALGVLHD